MRKIALVLLIILAFGVRLYKIEVPLLDWHSWRQADTSAVSRNFAKDGFDLFHPRFDDLSNVASGRENPQGYRMVEFPIYNLLQAGGYKLWPGVGLEVWGRLVSIVASVGSMLFLFGLVAHFGGYRLGWLAALFWVILPYNIYYGRVVLPEPLLVFLGLGTMYWWVKGKWVVSLVLAAMALLIKPFVAFYWLPLAYWAYKKRDARFLLFGLTFSPFIWWRWWISHFPEGVPASLWLLNGNGIRFKGAFFYWLFAERIGRLILGCWGLVLLGFGLAAKKWEREGWFFGFWLAGGLAYLTIVATGNVQHDYYQILVVPILCVYLAKGADYLVSRASYVLLIVCISFMVAFSWYQVRDFFRINNKVLVEAGEAVDRLISQEAKVIAPYGGDTAFLYQTKRRGWPVGIEVEKMRNLGAQYYVNVNFGPETDWLEETYGVVEKNSRWVLIDLTSEK